jgi:hypothetical protein
VGKLFERIDDRLAVWIGEQALFFVGTAPLAGDGHVNVSPKGPIGSLRVMGEKTIAYLDCVGSGAETIAHLRENGRIVIMLCAFAGPPRILRIHGRGQAVLPSDPRFEELLARYAFEDPSHPAARRAIVVVEVMRVADSCGYGVPLMDFREPRTQMNDWGAKKVREGGAQALADYKRAKNATSIDGLPAIDVPPDT